MNEVSKLILNVILSFTVSMLTYYIQFRRNKRIDYKAHLNALYNLMFETIRTADYQIQKIQEYISKIEGNIEVLPLIVIPSYPASKYLHDKILLDDCYIAFTRLFSNVLDSSKVYFSLKLNAVTYDKLSVQIQEITEESLKIYRARTIEHRDLYFKCMDEITALTRLRNVPKPEMFIIVQLNHTYLKFLQNRQPNDDNGNLLEINSNFTSPLLNTFTDIVVDPIFIPLLSSLQQLYRLNSAIVKSNQSIIKTINSMLPLLNNAFNQIKDIYSGLSKNPYYLSD